jgi:hypothetical protein
MTENELNDLVVSKTSAREGTDLIRTETKEACMERPLGLIPRAVLSSPDGLAITV